MASAIPVGFRALPLPIIQLSLAAVLKCGQSFRWSAFPLILADHSGTNIDHSVPTHEYRFCLRDRLVCLRQSSDTLFYRSIFPDSPLPPLEEVKREGETLIWLKDYFQLDVDLVKLYDEWSTKDPVFARLRSRFAGIRMLRQDPWENLVSFICSSNNNIARITKMVNALCKHYSPPLVSVPPPSVQTRLPSPVLDDEGDVQADAYHPFPPPSRLAQPDVASTLRSLGFGYRAEFIQKTAKMLVEARPSSPSTSESLEPSEKWLTTLRTTSTEEARQELLKFIGVGPKVADCVLLMSLDKREVIPVDTHVHQIAMKHYGLRSAAGGKKANMTPKLYEEVNQRLFAIWGDYAGWAHTVLFTADLKSFSSYGLPPPSPVPTPTKERRSADTFGPALTATLALTASPSPSTRKRGRPPASRTPLLSGDQNPVIDTQLPNVLQTFADHTESSEGASLADRVKKRRRVAKTVIVRA
ncbi:hypothetical protein JAAARDRAFT_32029 [Jaapia argillacea MUCL 33604]|uniref:DNA-(apurinic or apyrimidinic site) lyase n=1 Tax=Jaapia argillacea MUCL 33604 TaxID=933084 RepID=A0A067Q1T6_9AGAM|nr:hypothetical protein JAAARDRAFT_32029 [Jaapia argillacea MUCL 33604]